MTQNTDGRLCLNNIKTIIRSKSFITYFSNTSWIMTERMLSMGILFLVTIIVARYLGPEQFGILSYAISLVALFSSAGHMGLSGLVVREIVKHPKQRKETLGSTFWIKLFGFSVGFILLLLFISFTEEIGGAEFWVVIIVAASMFFQSSNVIDFWFEAHLQAKYSSISKIVAIVVSSAFKIVLALAGTHIIFFAFANIIQTALSAIVLFYFYKKFSDIPISEWKASLTKAKELLKQGWMIFLGSIFAVMYLKMDQIMLKWFAGSEEVGIYAVAATLSEAWYFFPVAIVASFFPRLIKLKDSNPELYRSRLQQIFDLLFMLALVIALFITFMAQPIISFMFGQSYFESANILVVHIWAALFIFMRAAFSKWILIENVLMFSLITQGLGALVNILLNLIFIPKYGGMGAAYATLISYATASYIALVFYSKTRTVFLMMTNAIVSPLRYLFLLARNIKI
jgi:O-antigen/teichoic acid export membrane protein